MDGSVGGSRWPRVEAWAFDSIGTNQGEPHTCCGSSRTPRALWGVRNRACLACKLIHSSSPNSGYPHRSDTAISANRSGSRRCPSLVEGISAARVPAGAVGLYPPLRTRLDHVGSTDAGSPPSAGDSSATSAPKEHRQTSVPPPRSRSALDSRPEERERTRRRGPAPGADPLRVRRSRLELVAQPPDGDDEAGRGRLRLDLGAQALDVHVKRLGVTDVVGTPDPVDELPPGEHPARVAQ
ncbi:hypothetical protein GA0070612_1762 [Micromonospora chokoriensis]|uniref:Uncharacterized protein n=1 Tax=Micromonospora chokoriensis TaxID=356851 RepID=A0A1C4VTB0_9ACTN|nr:hypothetical protein GA0070612_1762 [Micromonospora chokoriensis]